MNTRGVAVVENDCFVSDRITAMLADSGSSAAQEFAVVYVAETVEELLAATAGGVVVDVVLLDVLLADGSRAIDNVDRIMTAGLPLLTMTSEPDHTEVAILLRQRSVNFLAKSNLKVDLPAALRRTLAGDVVMKQDVLGRARAGVDRADPGLTEREEDVFRAWATGMPVKRVARRLDIREDTTRKHMAKISEKFRRINRPIDDPVRRYEVAIEFGYLDPPRR